MGSPKHEESQIVRMAPLKKVAATLPPSSLVRRLISKEPDVLGRGAYLDRAEILVHAAFAEIEATKIAREAERPLVSVVKTIEQLAENP